MEISGGILGRLGEKILGWIALALIVAAGIALWQMGADGRGALWSAVWRTAAWLVIAAALPWSARFFMSRVLAVGENWAGAALIAVYTLVMLLVGLVLIGGLPSGGWGWTASLAAIGASGAYNFLVCEYLAESLG